MAKYKLEYIWLDGKQPIPELRGKTQLKDFETTPTLADMPLWGFDGSSTMQAEGSKSDCILKPVALYPDASRKSFRSDARRKILDRRAQAPQDILCYVASQLARDGVTRPTELLRKSRFSARILMAVATAESIAIQ